jgi:hypothetical protein
MSRTVVLRGHVVGPKAVALDSPAPPDAVEAEVRLSVRDAPSGRSLSEILRGLPPGTRTAADIEAQIEDERSSWGE